MSVSRTFQRLLGSLRNFLIKVMRGGGPNMSPLTVFYPTQHLAKCIMRADALRLVPAQDAPFALILWYVAKIIYLS